MRRLTSLWIRTATGRLELGRVGAATTVLLADSDEAARALHVELVGVLDGTAAPTSFGVCVTADGTSWRIPGSAVASPLRGRPGVEAEVVDVPWSVPSPGAGHRSGPPVREVLRRMPRWSGWAALALLVTAAGWVLNLLRGVAVQPLVGAAVLVLALTLHAVVVRPAVAAARRDLAADVPTTGDVPVVVHAVSVDDPALRSLLAGAAHAPVPTDRQLVVLTGRPAVADAVALADPAAAVLHVGPARLRRRVRVV